MSNTEIIKEADVNYRPLAIKYGVIGALITVVIGLVMYMMDMMDPTDSTMSTIIASLAYIVVLVLAVKSHRDDDLEGFISFKRAFSVAILTSVVMVLIGMVWNYIFMGFIAPEMIDIIKEAQIQKMANNGLDDDQIEQAMETVGLFMTPGAIAIMGAFFGMLMGLVFSLIIAAIMKKEA